MEHYMTDAGIAAYLRHLEQEERAVATIEKYDRALSGFAGYLDLSLIHI